MTLSIPFGSRSTADQVLAGIDLTRRRMVVTGCDSAIGLETMKALSANGARVIGVARTLHDAEAACSAVGRSLTPLGCDPTDFPSVDAAVEAIRRLSGTLDAAIIICDNPDRPALQSNPGFESSYCADRIAQFALANRFAELVRSGTGRVAIGSNDANIAEAPAEALTLGSCDSDSCAAHGQGKLATGLFASELSRRVGARGVMVNSFNSGATENWNSPEDRRAVQRLIQSVLRYFTRSPAQQAATPALLAASPLAKGITGAYWSNCQISHENPGVSHVSLAERLWDLSTQIAAMAPAQARQFSERGAPAVRLSP